MLIEKLRRLAAEVSYWPRTLDLIWTAAPRHTLLWAILLLVQGLLPGALVYLTKLVVDRLVAALGTGAGWDGLQLVIPPLALFAASLLALEAAEGVAAWVRAGQAEHVFDHIKALVHQQSTALDLAFYESPEWYDRLDQAQSEASTRPLALLESMGRLVQDGVTLLAMGAVLLPYGAWVPVALLVSTLPALYVVLRFERRYHRWWERTTAERRRLQYYDAVLTRGDSATEVRLFGLRPYFQPAYQAIRRRLRAERLHHLRDQSLAKLGAGLAALLVTGSVTVWMLARAAQGLVTLGDLVLFYQAFQRGQGLMRSLLASVSQIYSNTLFLGNLFAFLDLRPQITDPPRPRLAPARLETGITFREVTFYYPGSDRPALADFNLAIPANRIVAIVGPNGAGKSTLVKLLCRLYDPQAGRIELDGIDLCDLPVAELRRRVTVLFQLAVPYQATAGENIALGDFSAADPAKVELAARSAGAHDLIQGLPRGYDTRLGKLFPDGVELSGGEWQRIATARAYLRRTPIIVLDEPTSFLDSWAEAEWFERFRTLARDRTAIIITHRFTVARRADLIYVMDRGRVVESGSHADLLALGGLYARSWTAQMEPGAEAAAPFSSTLPWLTSDR